MSLEDVSVSLSRLALAKAIKTPDTDEIEAEPWSKSVIFHQSHITNDMKNSIMNPQSIKKGRKYIPRQPKPSPQYPQQLYPQQQQQLQQQPYPQQQHPYPQQHHLPAPMNRTRSSDRPQSSSSSSISSNNKSSVIMHSAITKNNRRFVPSDDEEEEEEEDEEESESEGEEQEPKTVINRQPQTSKPDMKPLSTTSISTGAPKLDINIPPPEIIIGNNNNKEKGKVSKRTIQPSDDEDSEEEEEQDDDDDEEKEEEEEEKEEEEVEKVEHKEHEQHMYDRRMSTLKQLERGPSVHRRARSTGDVTQEVQQQQQQHPIEQWRMSVLDVDTPGSTVSSTTPSDDLIEEPVFRISTPSSANYPRSVSEMDMYNTYLQQQQQMAYNMQMQHMMQMAQAQQMAQMAQFQQYQQAMQLQQQQQQQQQKQKNRKSVSAMDLMMQLEEEKAATRKNRKKMPDPSKANFADGFLSKLPEQGTHNINFQQMQQHHQHHQMTRASKSDYNVNKLRPVGQNAMGQRPSSTLMYYDPRMTMMRSESSPIPTISMSTPIQQQQQQFMPMMQQQNRSNQHLHQQQKRTSTYNLYK